MKSALPKGILLIAWSVPACAALAVALQVLLTWLAPAQLHLALIIVLFVVGVFPVLLLAYIAASKRFGLGWHWFVATVASLFAVEIGRAALSGLGIAEQFKSVIHASCAYLPDAGLDQVQQMAASCGVAGWLSLASATFVRTLAGGLILLTAAWGYKNFFRRGRASNG